MRKTLLGALAAGFIVVAFCGVLLWHDPVVFWNDDYELSILPVFADVARSWGEGHWPLLSPYSWVCGNLAGEYQYGTFSVFVNAAVVLIWKFPLTFPQQAAALSIVHLVVLALGAYLLGRRRGFNIPLSIFVSLVATLNGWNICWGATDWFGAIAALAWLPWCWWALERAQDRQRKRWRFLWPAPFVYLLVTGGFPYTVLMLALLVAGLSLKSLGETKNWMPILPMLAGVALGIGMAAPAWLALLDYTSDSARLLTAAHGHSQWLVPWRAWPALFVPAWTVNWPDFSSRMNPHRGMELACGLVAPAAMLAALFARSRTLVRQMKWELALLALLFVLCMVPSAGLFRWSFRWLPFFHLTLAVIAGKILQNRQPAALVALFFVGVIAVTTSLSQKTAEFAFPLTWILLGLAFLWFALERRVKTSWLVVGVTFASLLATYLYVPPNCGVPKYNLSQDLTTAAPLDPQRLYLSLYSPPEWAYRVEAKPQPVGQLVRPGSTSMWAGLRFVNGYSPILGAGIAREWHFAIHGEIDLSYAEPIVHDASGLLAELGIGGLILGKEAWYQPASDQWERVFENDEARVFHRKGAAWPTVRSVSEIAARPNEQFAIAQLSNIRDTRNRVVVDVDLSGAAEPALIKFTRPYFRGYVASLGGRSLRVTSDRGLVPLVELPANSRGTLVLSYRPRWLIYGGAWSILSWSIFAAGLVAAMRSQYTSRL